MFHNVSVAALGVCNAAVTLLAKSRDPGTRFTCRFCTDRVFFLLVRFHARPDQMWRLQLEFGRLLDDQSMPIFLPDKLSNRMYSWCVAAMHLCGLAVVSRNIRSYRVDEPPMEITMIQF
jgi:hypothetical protein